MIFVDSRGFLDEWLELYPSVSISTNIENKVRNFARWVKFCS